MARNMTLLTDLYEITMAQGYWSQGKLDTEACFYSFYRDNPFGGGYGIFCGANQIAELIDGFGFTDDDIEYLASLPSPAGTPLFDPEFLAWLTDLELSVDICAVPEGSPVFPREPLVRVMGPLLQCQLARPRWGAFLVAGRLCGWLLVSCQRARGQALRYSRERHARAFVGHVVSRRAERLQGLRPGHAR